MASAGDKYFTDFLTYTPANGDLLVSRLKHTIYYRRGDEALYAISETFLTNFTWDQVFSFFNDNDGEVKKTLTFTQGLTTTEGSEVSTTFGINGTFKGIGLNFGTSSKSFETVETSEVSTDTTEIPCLPHALTIYFQRRYRFRTRVWYLLDAWKELIRVGGLPRFDGDKNYTLTYSECRHEIKSQDFFLTHAGLSGKSTFTATPDPPVDYVPSDWARQFQNTTDLCQFILLEQASEGLCTISGYNDRGMTGTKSVNKIEDERSEYIKEEYPPDESQGKIVTTSKRTSDAPPGEDLPAATAEY